MELMITKLVAETLSVDAIRCNIPVNYDEEDMPNDYPHRTGDMWNVTIDIATGQILDWPQGVQPRDLEMKVVDGGCYYLLSQNNVVASIEDDYVPKCIPGDYGDYIEFNIDAGGRITNWKCDANRIRSSFFKSDDD